MQLLRTFGVEPVTDERIVQSADRYQILALSRHSARLFEGNRDRVDEIALAPEVPRDLDDLAMREAQRDRASRTHGRVEPGVMGRHGASDVKQDGIEGDTEKFFREVDRAVLEHHSRPSGWPPSSSASSTPRAG